MSLLLTKKSIEKSPWLLGCALKIVSQEAGFLRSNYPCFDVWFTSKVLPGISAGERTLLIEERSSVAVGLLILKHTNDEKKLCTLRVRSSFEGRGIGIYLFQTAFQILETERPLLSVSEPIAPKFKRLFEYFGFAQEATYPGIYRPLISEFSYNGLLDVSPSSIVPHAHTNKSIVGSSRLSIRRSGKSVA